MEIQESHDIYTRLTSIQVTDTAYFGGATLARALRSPRPTLAVTLLAEGAISKEACQLLDGLWSKMKSIQPLCEGGKRVFDNIYDLVLWVYVQTPDYEVVKGDASPVRLVFRGHRDASWRLETTLQRLLKESSDEAHDRHVNLQRIDLFIRAAQVAFKQKLLETELEKQAVAQHYGERIGQHRGFATSLLDFSTDVDVAAWFATQKPIQSTEGTIFMGDTRTLLKDGRVRLVKIPELFRRPNVQRGLFIELPEASVTSGHEDEIPLLTRLNFHQQALEKYDGLHHCLGDIWPTDEVSTLAAHVKAGEVAEGDVAQWDLYAFFAKLHDPERSEISTLSERLFSLAGVITDDAKFELLEDVCQELVGTSPMAVDGFVATAYLQPFLTYYADAPVTGGDARDAPWWVPTLLMAERLLTLCKQTGRNVSHLERAKRTVDPKSILLVGSKLPTLEERAVSLASRMQLRMEATPTKTDNPRRGLYSMDFAEMPAHGLSTLCQCPDIMHADQFTLIVKNVHCLKDRVGQENAERILSALCVREYGIVATALRDFSLAAYFDVILPD